MASASSTLPAAERLTSAEVPVRSTVTTYPLARAEQALADLRAGAFEGTAVLLP